MDPAGRNNLVGYKPSRGLIATDGAIPISNRQDVIGTLTRTVQDAALLLNSMAGRSEEDDRTWHIPFNPLPDFAALCKETVVSEIRIGIPRNAFDDGTPKYILDAFELAIGKIKSAGATVIDGADFAAAEDFKKLNDQVKGIVRSSEFKRDIKSYLETLTSNPNNIKTAEDIIEYTKNEPKEDYPAHDIGKFLWTQAEGIDVDSDKYHDMVKQELYFGGEGGITGALEKYGVDVLAVPSTEGISNDLAAKMGFPVIVIPLGFSPADTEVEYDDGMIEVGPGLP